MRLSRNGGNPPSCIFPLMLSFHAHTRERAPEYIRALLAICGVSIWI